MCSYPMTFFILESIIFNVSIFTIHPGIIALTKQYIVTLVYPTLTLHMKSSRVAVMAGCGLIE